VDEYAILRQPEKQFHLAMTWGECPATLGQKHDSVLSWPGTSPGRMSNPKSNENITRLLEESSFFLIQ
jgi:hypothetical protein